MTLIIYLLLGTLVLTLPLCEPFFKFLFLINPIKDDICYLLMLDLHLKKYHLSSPQGSSQHSLSRAIYLLIHYS